MTLRAFSNSASARSARRRSSAISRSRRSTGLRPRGRPSCLSAPSLRCLRQYVRCDVYKPSRRSSSPTSPGRVHASARSRISSLYFAVNVRRLACSTSSGSATPSRPGRAAARSPRSPTARSATWPLAPMVLCSDIPPRLRSRPQAQSFRDQQRLNRAWQRGPPELELHLILDNYATHKTPAIQRWLAAHPRFVLHFTPTGASWLNLVERWFAELTNRKLRRGTHRCLRELNADIHDWIEHWNEHPRPFVWTKTADQILDSIRAYLQRINDSRH